MRTDAECVRVRQVGPTPNAETLTMLGRLDYRDAFLVDVGPTGTRTAEQWARLILEDAPPSVRLRLLAAWTTIGLKLNLSPSPGDRSVLGWKIRSDDPDFVLLGADSRIGMPGELLVRRAGDQLLFCTFVRCDNVLARVLWAAIEAAHVRTVRALLEFAGRGVAG